MEKKHREKIRNTGKTQGKHREFYLDSNVATLRSHQTDGEGNVFTLSSPTGGKWSFPGGRSILLLFGATPVSRGYPGLVPSPFRGGGVSPGWPLGVPPGQNRGTPAVHTTRTDVCAGGMPLASRRKTFLCPIFLSQLKVRYSSCPPPPHPITIFCIVSETKLNKKVLLCERKRHTARRIGRTRTAVPAGGCGLTHKVKI